MDNNKENQLAIKKDYGFEIKCLDCGNNIIINNYANKISKMKGNITFIKDEPHIFLNCICGNDIHFY